MRPAEETLALRHALALGLLQGPAELLPVSSSAHTTLIPWLAGWPYARLDGELRKSFEVAIHAGAGLALAIDMRGELRDGLATMDGQRAGVLALTLLPPALAGYTLRGAIERHLGGPRSIAAGMALGGLAMGLADWRSSSTRRCADARALDGLLLGLAQAAALVPGVSRNGSALTAARARGFERESAQAFSWNAALPVILGAGALKGARLIRHGAPRRARAGLALGGAAAFVSTLASARILDRRDRPRSLLGYSIYRCLLAGLVMMRLRRAQ
jgi:undecaprenyl-diphosphatase